MWWLWIVVAAMPLVLLGIGSFVLDAGGAPVLDRTATSRLPGRRCSGSPAMNGLRATAGGRYLAPPILWYQRSPWTRDMPLVDGLTIRRTAPHIREDGPLLFETHSSAGQGGVYGAT
jgi:hypothetical protein